MGEPVRLFDGDQKLEALTEAVIELVYERGEGCSVPSILGVLDLVKIQIIKDAQ